MYDIVIIGAGTAGLSAAIYGIRAGKTVLVLEGESYGGQIINSPEVENYPGIKNISGFEFATNLYEQAVSLGAEIIFEQVTRVEHLEAIYNVVTTNKKIEAKTVIIASGVKRRSLGLENEKELIGAGVSYCATCDGMFFRGKDVVVVGGGSTALEDTIFLSEYCNKVYLIHRRDKFRGEDKLIDIVLKKENVQCIMNTTIEQLISNDKLSGVKMRNINTNEIQELSIKGLFVAVGQVPSNDIFNEIVNLDESGYIIAGEDCKTNIEGILVAGDCRTKKVRQLATAAADGAVAALGACELLN